MERNVEEFLRSFGIKDSYDGFAYCVYSVELETQEPQRLEHVTKLLYPDVAKKFKTNYHNVERCIRTVVENVWKRGGGECLIGISESKRPTNTEFLWLLLYWKFPELDSEQALKGNLKHVCWRQEYTAAEFLRNKIAKLEAENTELRRKNSELMRERTEQEETITWMHDMIRKLLNEKREGADGEVTDGEDSDEK